MPVCSVSQDVQGFISEHLKVPRPSLCWGGSSESQASPWHHIFTFGASRVFPAHAQVRQSRLELGCTSLSPSWLLWGRSSMAFCFHLPYLGRHGVRYSWKGPFHPFQALFSPCISFWGELELAWRLGFLVLRGISLAPGLVALESLANEMFTYNVYR